MTHCFHKFGVVSWANLFLQVGSTLCRTQPRISLFSGSKITQKQSVYLICRLLLPCKIHRKEAQSSETNWLQKDRLTWCAGEHERILLSALMLLCSQRMPRELPEERQPPYLNFNRLLMFFSLHLLSPDLKLKPSFHQLDSVGCMLMSTSISAFLFFFSIRKWDIVSFGKNSTYY